MINQQDVWHQIKSNKRASGEIGHIQWHITRKYALLVYPVGKVVNGIYVMSRHEQYESNSYKANMKAVIDNWQRFQDECDEELNNNTRDWRVDGF